MESPGLDHPTQTHNWVICYFNPTHVNRVNKLAHK